jgi:hypothetical protein
MTIMSRPHFRLVATLLVVIPVIGAPLGAQGAGAAGKPRAEKAPPSDRRAAGGDPRRADGAVTPSTIIAPPGPSCALEYRRADNPLTLIGDVTEKPGAETVSVPPGQTRDFVSDWKYASQRNDGTTYYGSHLRRARNAGPRDIVLLLRGPGDPNGTFSDHTLDKVYFVAGLGWIHEFTYNLKPGVLFPFKSDLLGVRCP